MKRLIGILVIWVVLANSAMADVNDFRCFKSIDLKNTLRLQFVFRTNKDDAGYVIYQSGSGPIPVKLMKETELRRVSGRPSLFETRWREISSTDTGGAYAYENQGAIIDNFRYLRKDGKVFRFVDDSEGATDNGCAWTPK